MRAEGTDWVGEPVSAETHRAIVDATIRYCWAIDGRHWADLAHVFTSDATADYGVVAPLEGLPAIQAFVAKTLEPLDASHHMVSNHQVVAQGGETRSRSYFHAQHVRRKASNGANFVIAGVYRDRWAQTPQGWRIAARELEMTWSEGNPAVVGRRAR